MPRNFRFKCKYYDCFCNKNGLCETIYLTFPYHLIHPMIKRII